MLSVASLYCCLIVESKKCCDSHHCHEARPGGINRRPGVGQHEGNEVDECCYYVNAFPGSAFALDGHEAAEQEKGHFPGAGNVVMAVQLEVVVHHSDGSAGSGMECVSGEDSNENDGDPCCPD